MANKHVEKAYTRICFQINLVYIVSWTIYSCGDVEKDYLIELP